MFTKNLIALCFIVLAVHGAVLSVGDNEQFKKPAFFSIFKLSNLNVDEGITVSLQWGDQTAQFPINVYLFQTLGTQGTPINCDFSSSINTCTVSFDSTYTLNSGDYWLSIEYNTNGNSFVLSGNSVVVSTITVIGDSTLRTNPLLLKQTFVPGQYRFHRVYFSTPSTISIILPYTDTNNQESLYNTEGIVRVFPEYNGSPSYYLGSEISASFPSPDDVSSAQTVTWTYSVPAGFSWVVIDLTAANSISYPTDDDFTSFAFQYRLSYSTETYDCPNLVDYPDVSGVFRGCQYKSDNSKLPCINWDSITSTCVACYPGYDLSNGKCVESACPAGQYKKYGNCIPNPTGCATYSDFAKCTQCSTGYTLTNGTCSRTPLTCSGRTFFNSTSWTCDKVDDKCKLWGSDGKCTSCLNVTEKPVNGVCVSIDSTCTSTQYVDTQGNCVQNNPLCDLFEKWGGKCLKCVWGYQISNATGKCAKIICPDRYVPNDYGKCAKVSDLCDVYDVRGNCLACIPTHVLSANGVCLQLQTPNPCPPRQYLGDDNFCHEASDFCEVYNNIGGQCSQCINGYFLMYTGQCVMQKNCTSRQILINNDCHDVSPTCGNYDRATGKCLNCVSSDYELYYGLCIPVTSCGGRQWTDNNGGCHDVDNKCNTFNPSTGDCTSCVQGYNYLNGICCVKGQFNINGQCAIATSASATSNQNGCRSYVNGIGCVRCDTGFQKLQDSNGFYYCQAL